MTPQEKALQAFDEWYNGLPVYKATGGPARGSIGAALVVLERLKKDYDLNLDFHRATTGKSQIVGLSGDAVKKILSRFGETRRFVEEGGRTNRGAAGAVGSMLETMKTAKLEKLAALERIKILEELQHYLVERVQEYHSRERLKFTYDPTLSAWQSIHELLAKARETGKEGPVAQYLVGAKLQLRFPDIEIGNRSYSTADDQLDSPGDYYVGDTVFHVTVSPMPAIYEKCRRNVEVGLRVYLLVSDRIFCWAKHRGIIDVQKGRVN